MSQAYKTKSEKHIQDAFSLIELLVSATILIIIGVSVLVNYDAHQWQLSLTDEAEKLKSNLKQTQSLALAGKKQGDILPIAYGVELVDTTSTDYYRIFADTYPADNGNYEYDSDYDELIATYNLPTKLSFDSNTTTDFAFSVPGGTVYMDGIVATSTNIIKLKHLTTDHDIFVRVSANGKIDAWSYNDDPDLVGYWELDEDSETIALDSSKKGNNGTWNGSSDHVTSSAKVGKHAGQADKGSDRIDCGNGGSLNVTSSMTVAAWVKKTANPISHRGIIGKWWNYVGQETKKSYNLAERSDDYKPYFIVSNDGTENVGKYNVVVANTSLLTNTWYHIVGVYVPSVSISIYINGVLETQNTSSIVSSIYNSDEKTHIAATDPADTDKLFNSTIDDVRIYNRALSADEVQQLYNATK